MAAQTILEDNVDPTQALAVDLTAINPGDLRTWEAPDHSGTVLLVLIGTGNPNGNVTANVGRYYADNSTGLLWQKRSGTGDTGWNPTASAVGAEPTSQGATVAAGYTFDALSSQVLTRQLDGDITTLNVANLDLVGTAIFAIEISVEGAGSAVLALDSSINIATGSLGDIGTSVGDKGTFFFWWDAVNSQPRVSIVGG